MLLRFSFVVLFGLVPRTEEITDFEQEVASNRRTDNSTNDAEEINDDKVAHNRKTKVK